MGPPRAAQDPASSPSGSGSSRRRFFRLDRRNASKNIGYDATNFCSYPPSPTPSSASLAGSAACSLDLVTSFRIGRSGDGGGDLQLLCESLGLSGPEDFAIPLADWEAHKAVSLSSASSSPSSARANPDTPARDSPLRREGAEEPARLADLELPAKEPAARYAAPIKAPEHPPRLDGLEPLRLDVKRVAGEGGIKGVRPPPVLKPPPSMAIPAVYRAGSTWDILASFAPDEKEHSPASRSGGSRERQEEEDEDEEAALVLTLEELGLGETSEDFTATSSMSTINDDEMSSTTTESMFYISPNGRFRRKIRSWNRGVLLGSGSFGTVYEGISEYVPYSLHIFVLCWLINPCLGTTIYESIFIHQLAQCCETGILPSWSFSLQF
jgi:mitogen-activated protein kinase kinase kinase 1